VTGLTRRGNYPEDRGGGRIGSIEYRLADPATPAAPYRKEGCKEGRTHSAFFLVSFLGSRSPSDRVTESVARVSAYFSFEVPDLASVS
jgi:hypothetical protein